MCDWRYMFLVAHCAHSQTSDWRHMSPVAHLTRRAFCLHSSHLTILDTNSPLPLPTSLIHLNDLTSTLHRIRKILMQDGGLERLVRLLRDFCFAPPPPENPTAIYGLSPPSVARPPPIPVLNPKNFDRHAAYRFSLALQCVVNIGVRGSEPIRSRVVQAGTLDVVGCILEAWLASKGFTVGPSSSASGLTRETREQRMSRLQQMVEQQHECQRNGEPLFSKRCVETRLIRRCIVVLIDQISTNRTRG